MHRRARGADYGVVLNRLVVAGADIGAPGNGRGASLLAMAQGNPAVQDASGGRAPVRRQTTAPPRTGVSTKVLERASWRRRKAEARDALTALSLSEAAIPADSEVELIAKMKGLVNPIGERLSGLGRAS